MVKPQGFGWDGQGVLFCGLHTAGELRLTLQEGPVVVARGSPFVYERATHIQ